MGRLRSARRLSVSRLRLAVGLALALAALTWSGTAWVTQATVTGNSAIEREVAFTATVSTAGVLITVTQDQATPQGEYTRINEVYPGLVAPAPSVVVDFGKDVVGYPRLALAGASANDPGLELAFSETQQYLTDTSDFTRSDNGDTITPGTDQVAVPAAPQTWTDANGCQHGAQVCDDGLHGFRYLRITLAALASDAPYTADYGTVRLSGVSLDFTAYLGAPSTYIAWDDGRGLAFGATLADGYVTLHGVRGGSPVSVSVRG